MPFYPLAITGPENRKNLYQQHPIYRTDLPHATYGWAEFVLRTQSLSRHFSRLAKGLSRLPNWVLGGPKDQTTTGTTARLTSCVNLPHMCRKNTGWCTAYRPQLAAAEKRRVSNDSEFLCTFARAVGTELHVFYGSTSELMNTPLTDKNIF